MSSPSVDTFEKDLTLNVNSIETNASSMVGLFNWGPINELVRITTNEGELVKRFGRPDLTTTKYFHSALNYMLYTVPLYVIRAIDADQALNAVPTDENPILVRNSMDYETFSFTGLSFVAKYAGALGNSLKVSVSNSVGYADWEYAGQFQYTPENDEMNIVVIDEDGAFTGVAGTVIERFELMKPTLGSKKTDGTSAYIVEVLEKQSNYVYVGDIDAIVLDTIGSEGLYETSLQGGADGNDELTADFDPAITQLSDTETLDIISSFSAGLPAVSSAQVVDVMDTRKDGVAFLAPQLTDIFNTPVSEATSAVLEYFNTTINKNTSYVFNVDNWKQVYDKYNDITIWIPMSSDAAALHARVFTQNEPWKSPAGFNRGQVKNVIKLAWNPKKPTRDVLYANNINSFVSFPGEGTVLFGDKTGLRRPSAFSRINVRSLFIVLKKSIAKMAKYQLFENNDVITQSIFRNAVDRFLNRVQGRRGILRYNVVCDATNNTDAVLNANEFVGDMYIDPAKSINRIRLNFIAVDSGVAFEEIEGV